MAEAPTPHHEPRQTRTLQFARFVTRNRFPVAMLLIASTLFWFYPILNAITTAAGLPLPGPDRAHRHQRARLLPGSPVHPRRRQVREGLRQLVAGRDRRRRQGRQRSSRPSASQKIREITRRLDGVGFDSHTEERDALRDELEEQGLAVEEIRAQLDRKFPPYPVNHNQVQSIAHGSTRVIQIEADGSLTQEVLMKKLPKTQEEADALRERVRQNPPFIFGRLVSRDEKGALITAGFVTDRLSNREVYTAVFKHIQKIKADLETDDVKIYITGQPILVGWVIKYAFEILAYVTATVSTIFVPALALLPALARRRDPGDRRASGR